MGFLGARQDIVVVLLCLMPWLYSCRIPGRRRRIEREKVREPFTGFFPSLHLLFVGFEKITQVK